MRTHLKIGCALIFAGLPVMSVACAANQKIPQHLAPCEQPGRAACLGTLLCDYDYARTCELCRCVSPKGPSDLHAPPLIAGPAPSSR